MAAYPGMPGMQTPMMYAQPGAAYYDPSYGYAADAAMSKEQKKQAKEAKRQRKLLEANERCEKMREKQREQDKKDSSCFLIMMSIAYIGLGSLMGLTIVGPAWGSKEFTGLGAGLVMMKTSLFNLRIDISCDKSFALESYTCNKVMKGFEGDHDLQRAQGNTCALVASACEVLGRCYIAGTLLHCQHATLRLHFAVRPLQLLCSFLPVRVFQVGRRSKPANVGWVLHPSYSISGDHWHRDLGRVDARSRGDPTILVDAGRLLWCRRNHWAPGNS